MDAISPGRRKPSATVLNRERRSPALATKGAVRSGRGTRGPAQASPGIDPRVAPSRSDGARGRTAARRAIPTPTRDRRINLRSGRVRPAADLVAPVGVVGSSPTRRPRRSETIHEPFVPEAVAETTIAAFAAPSTFDRLDSSGVGPSPLDVAGDRDRICRELEGFEVVPERVLRRQAGPGLGSRRVSGGRTATDHPHRQAPGRHPPEAGPGSGGDRGRSSGLTRARLSATGSLATAWSIQTRNPLMSTSGRMNGRPSGVGSCGMTHRS